MTKDRELVATMTRGQSEQSARYKAGDKVLYGRTECKVSRVRVSAWGWVVYDLEASNGQILDVPECSRFLKEIRPAQ
jgi:hypothetical protein